MDGFWIQYKFGIACGSATLVAAALGERRSPVGGLLALGPLLAATCAGGCLRVLYWRRAMAPGESGSLWWVLHPHGPAEGWMGCVGVCGGARGTQGAHLRLQTCFAVDNLLCQRAD